jgi:hypothetical protein
MAEVALPLAIANAGISAFGAQQQNQANRRSARIRGAQLTEAADLDKRRRGNEAQQIRSRLRLIAAENGVGFGGSFADLERQADIDEQLNLAAIDRNLYFERRNINSQVEASFRNPLLSAFTGALGGYSTGLQIENAYARANPAPETRPLPEPYPYDIDAGYSGEDYGNRPR